MEGDETENKEVHESLEKIFKEATGNDKLKIKVEGLKTASVPGIIILEEHSRRMKELSSRYGGFDMGNMFGNEETLVLNKKNDLIQQVLKINEDQERKEDVKMICEHIYDLAMMSHKQLEPEAMTRFIERSNKILSKLVS
jgi:molecular chaperone HtpG